MKHSVLIIGINWPEPEATAAGTRMMQLINFFKDNEYEVNFASASAKGALSADLDQQNINCFKIQLNHSSFNEQIKALNPDVVVFDRFLSEEQYGWRVRETCPRAMSILDTEDLHFLRQSRETAVKKGSDDWFRFLQNDTAKREIASIYRCDLSLIISSFEKSLLRQHFKVPDPLLFYLPFVFDKEKIHVDDLPEFNKRNHFMCIGNFKHKPNMDAVKYLKTTIWPLIRKELPEAELHIYGAYPTEAAFQLHQDKEGFIIKGWVEDKSVAFKNQRVCLAPIRFGAGQKGKLFEAMQFGTPSITTTLGAEGMAPSTEWNGFIADIPEAFAAAAVKLFKDKETWDRSRDRGFKILKTYYDKHSFEEELTQRLLKLESELDKHRSANFTGQMLAYHTLQSTKYFSKWIEEKNLPDNKQIKQ